MSLSVCAIGRGIGEGWSSFSRRRTRTGGKKIGAIVTLASLGLFGAIIGTADAQTQVAGVASNAWRDYRFQSFGNARPRFERILEHPDATQEQKADARLGLAMISQFSDQGDWQEADNQYQRILAQGNLSEGKAALVKTFRAEIDLDQGNTNAAMDRFDRVIKTHPDTLAAEDALLKMTLAQIKSYGTPSATQALHRMERKMERFPEATVERPGLRPQMHQLAADIWFFHGDYRQAVQHLKRFLDITTIETAGYNATATTHYRIARIYEIKLSNKEKAATYYRRLVEQTPNFKGSYFALERAILFGAMDRQDVRELDLPGVNENVIDELFAKKQRALQSNGSDS